MTTHTRGYRHYETHCPTCGQRYNAGEISFKRLVGVLSALIFGLFPVGLALGFILGRLLS